MLSFGKKAIARGAEAFAFEEVLPAADLGGVKLPAADFGAVKLLVVGCGAGGFVAEEVGWLGDIKALLRLQRPYTYVGRPHT